MSDKKKYHVTDLEEKLSRGLKIAYLKMLEFKKYKKTKVIVKQDGKIVALDPEEVMKIVSK